MTCFWESVWSDLYFISGQSRCSYGHEIACEQKDKSPNRQASQDSSPGTERAHEAQLSRGTQ